MPEHSPESRKLRSCMSRFITGVAVVTYAANHDRRGLTINSLTAVSAEPPLILVSVARSAHSHDLLLGRPFCINILGAEQRNIAMLFAGTRMSALPLWATDTSVPRLADPLAWMRCDPWRCYEGGDHTLVLGKMVESGYRGGDALTYGWSRYGSMPEGAEDGEFLFGTGYQWEFIQSLNA